MRLLWSITAYKKPFRVTWRGLVIAGHFFPIKFRLNLQQPLKWNQIRRNNESRTGSKKSDNILKKQKMFKKWLEASKTLDLNEIAFGKKQMSTSLFFETKNGNEVDHHYHCEDEFSCEHTLTLSLSLSPTHTNTHTHLMSESLKEMKRESETRWDTFLCYGARKKCLMAKTKTWRASFWSNYFFVLESNFGHLSSLP